MFKKFFVGSIVMAVSLIPMFSVSFAEDKVSDTVSVTATAEGGSIELVLEGDSSLKFQGELSRDTGLVFEVNNEEENKNIEYTLYDYSGSVEGGKVQFTFDDFVIEGGDETLIVKSFKTEKGEYEGELIQEYNASEENSQVIEGSVTFESITFSNEGFVKSGNYSSTLNVEVVNGADA